jgi:hypothetical protein
MKMIRWDDFKQPVSASAINDVVSALGELSRWMLNEEILNAASEIDLTAYWSTPPTLPVSIGCCWMLTVNADRETYRWLKPSFLLPLIWRCDSDHGSLPDALRDLANDVLAVTKQNSGDPQAKWGLHLFSESGDLDNVRFPECDPGQFNFPSGWVALAAGLMAAQQGYPPQGNVWATGCWDNSAGVTEVSGIPHKIDAINEYVTQHFETVKEAFLFVPPANVIQANCYIAEASKTSERNKISIVGFPSPQLDPNLALSSLLALSRIPPSPDAPIEAQVAYYKSTLEVDQKLAERYYETTLYPKIVLQCRERLPQMSTRPTCLVTVVSPNNELVKLAVEVFDIKKCVMLYTIPSDESSYSRQITDMTEIALKTKKECELLGCEVFPESFSYDAASERFRENLARDIRQKVQKYFGGYAPERIVYDMQSAHKIFNYTFDHAVADAGSLMYWIDHLWYPSLRTPLPATERFVTWRSGEPWLSSPEDH